jgi:hypothetical protein
MIQDFQTYKDHLSSLSFGKKVGQNLYIYFDDLKAESQELYEFIRHITENLSGKKTFNVVKFFINAFKISLLHYPDFWDDLHPVLHFAVTIELDNGKTREINYVSSGNPPILHRKETLISPSRKEYRLFQKQTELEESYGLFEHPKTIGFKQQWEALLATKGVTITGNIVSIQEASDEKKYSQPDSECNDIDRHKTAISRSNFSKPVQILLQYDQIKDTDTFFDYGCGLGDDVRGKSPPGFSPAFRSCFPGSVASAGQERPVFRHPFLGRPIYVCFRPVCGNVLNQ